MRLGLDLSIFFTTPSEIFIIPNNILLNGRKERENHIFNWDLVFLIIYVMVLIFSLFELIYEWWSPSMFSTVRRVPAIPVPIAEATSSIRPTMFILKYEGYRIIELILWVT